MASRLKSTDGFYGWVNLVVMFFFNIVFMMMLSFALFLPSWVKEFSWSRGDMSLAQAVAMVLTGLAAPLVGIFIMRKVVKTAIILGNILSIAGLIMVSFQQHIWQLFLGYGVLVGLFNLPLQRWPWDSSSLSLRSRPYILRLKRVLYNNIPDTKMYFQG